jgi:hypothetical protein
MKNDTDFDNSSPPLIGRNMLLVGPVMAEDFGKARIQPKPSPLFEAADPENEAPAANSGRFTPLVGLSCLIF